jgi:hypothetical protein
MASTADTDDPVHAAASLVSSSEQAGTITVVRDPADGCDAPALKIDDVRPQLANPNHGDSDDEASPTGWLKRLLRQLVGENANGPTMEAIDEFVASTPTLQDSPRPHRLVDYLRLWALDLGPTAPPLRPTSQHLAGSDQDPYRAAREGATYLGAVANYYLKYHQSPRDDGYRDLHGYLLDGLTSLGTSEGYNNASVGALAYGPVALHQTLDAQPRTLRLAFAPAAWRSTRPSTGYRSLQAIALLSRAFNVEIVIPAADATDDNTDLLEDLRRRYGAWVDANLDLTETAATPQSATGGSPDEWADDDGPLERDAVSVLLSELPNESAKTGILGTLARSGETTVKALQANPRLDYAVGTITAEVHTLENWNLVAVSRRTGRASNRVSLTPAGQQVAAHISHSGSQRAIGQTSLAGFTDADRAPPHGSPSTVYGPPEPEEGGEGADTTTTATTDDRDDERSWTVPMDRSTIEDQLTSFPDPETDGEYVQFLPAGERSGWELQEVLLASHHTDGWNLVDHDVQRFGTREANTGHGKAVLLSDLGRHDQVLAVTQWGGPLSTLGRLATALLCRLATSEIVDETAVGEQFEHVDRNFQEVLDTMTADIIHLGRQLGWLSTDDIENFDGWRDRIATVGTELLAQLGTLAQSGNYDARRQLFRKFHGLLTTATHLYDAVGLDLCISLRLPDPDRLILEEAGAYRRYLEHRHTHDERPDRYYTDPDFRRYVDFLDFVRYTAPKHTAYKYHSGPRMLAEDRSEKLKARLPYDVDETDPLLSSTASWAIEGRGVSRMRSDILDALEGFTTFDVRDSVQAGHEETAGLELSVDVLNRRPILEDLVESWTDAKGYQLADRASDPGLTARQATDCLLAGLADSVTPYRASPRDIVQTFLCLRRSTRPGDVLRRQDIQNGLVRLPPSRVFPSWSGRTGRAGAPGKAAALQALLAADAPLSRSEILEAAGISTSSYERYFHAGKPFRDALTAIDVLSYHENGQGAWSATLSPEWATDSATTREDDLLVDAVAAAASSPEGVTSILAADAWMWPPDINSIYDYTDWLSNLRPLVANTLPPDRRLSTPPETDPPATTCGSGTVRAGSPPIPFHHTQSELLGPSQPVIDRAPPGRSSGPMLSDD